MFILHCAPVSHNSINGLCRSVSSLAIGQYHNNNKVGLITLKESERIVPKEIYWKSLGKQNILTSYLKDPFIDLIKYEGRPDIVNFHDIYNIKQIFLIKHALKNDLKIYITPRGAFSPVALKRSRIKKFIFINILIRPLIKKIEGIVALNKNEKLFINKLFSKKTIIISNGIKNNKKLFNNNLYIYKEKKLKKDLIIGFVGRFDIHIKGLDTLLNAFLEYQKSTDLNKICLVFLGDHRIKKNEYDSEKYFESVKNKLIDKSKFKILPPIYSNKKFIEISKFDLLIQPSRTEGMPNTVLEAMSIGIPCCVSPETNMEDIIKSSNGGWVINRDIEDIKNFFLMVEKCDKNQLYDIGIKGMDYAYKHLLWDTIGKTKYS